MQKSAHPHGSSPKLSAPQEKFETHDIRGHKRTSCRILAGIRTIFSQRAKASVDEHLVEFRLISTNHEAQRSLLGALLQLFLVLLQRKPFLFDAG